MNSSKCPCKKLLAEKAQSLGIEKTGVTKALPVTDTAIKIHEQWLSSNHHGEMKYMERYGDVRNNPQNLLPSARSIISCAINYYPAQRQRPNVPQIASYALGKDYHEVVRERLDALALFLRETYGGETRVCVDTAPIRERYWAQQSGIGFIGLNNQLIIPGKGSFFFLGEIITTLEIEPDEPCMITCGECRKCLESCPTGALRNDGSCDARRCLSYLTIEYRGDLPDNINIGNHLYGCDNCQIVCPHNRNAEPTNIKEFHPTERLMNLNSDDIERMTQQEFSELFRHSAIKRTKLAGLQRNMCYIKESDSKREIPGNSAP